MYLKKLHIKSFKGFGDKTEIQFYEGVGAFVGPNGCGKSNIIDAIKWCLGEQKVSELRGERMEDLIFTGSSLSQPHGFAEVEMIFDNSTKIFELPYQEVSIKRRLYRSGEMSYFMNGLASRLKDIHGLLENTGLADLSYSIIAQGKIDKMLSADDSERIILFEEAAGIRSSRERQREYERKILRAKENLVRISDIERELGKRRAYLQVQAEESSQFYKLEQELQDIEMKRAYLEYKDILEKQLLLKKSLGAAQEELKSSYMAVEKLQQAEIAQQNSGQNLRQSLFDWEKNKLILENTMASFLERKQYFETSLEGYEATRNQHAGQDLAVEKRKNLIQRELETLKKKSIGMAQQEKNFRSHIHGFQQKLQKYQKNLSHLESTLDEEAAASTALEAEILNINLEEEKLLHEIQGQLDSWIKTFASFLQKTQEEKDLLFKELKELKQAKALGMSNLEKPKKKLLTWIDNVQEFLVAKKVQRSVLPEFKNLERVSQKKASLALQKKRIQVKLDSLMNSQAGHQQKLANTRKKIDETKNSLLIKNEESKSLSAMKSYHEKNQQELAKRQQDTLLESQQIRELLEKSKNQKQNAVTEIKALSEKIKLGRKQQQSQKKPKLGLAKKHDDMERKLERQRELLRKKEFNLSRIKMNIELAEKDRAALIEKVKNLYHEDMLSFVKTIAKKKIVIKKGSEAALALASREASQQFRAFKAINPIAKEELKTADTEYKTLKKERMDITNSLKNLSALNTKIELKSKKLLTKTFKVINKNFAQITATLFPQGRGHLELEYSRNPAERKAKIFVQPQGKQVKKLNLFSGGEKTLIMLALMFAIFMTRPSIFCILDEADAALDDENLSQFVKLIEKFKGKSQVLLISHNRKTFQSFEYIYGVTMRGGISKVFSLKVDE